MFIVLENRIIHWLSYFQRKGQKNITEFFPSTKLVASPYKKPTKIPKYQVEKIVQDLRGDNVKILWIPSGHYDLDPSQFVTVFLRNEIVLRVDSNEDADVRASFDEALSRLPNGVWTRASKFMEESIAFYLNGGNIVKDEAGPPGLTKEDFDATVAAFELQAAEHSRTDNETDKENFAIVEVKVEIEEKDDEEEEDLNADCDKP